MKKLSTIAAALLLGATMASANSYSNGVQADIHAGAAQAAYSNAKTTNNTVAVFKDDNAATYNFGMGLKKTFDSGIFIGGNIDYEYISTNGNNPVHDSTSAVYLDARAGYTFADVSLYAIGGIRAVQGSGDFVGYGYGGGAEWQFAKHFAVNTEYKEYTMSGAVVDFDYRVVGGNLKYYF